MDVDSLGTFCEILQEQVLLISELVTKAYEVLTLALCSTISIRAC